MLDPVHHFPAVVAEIADRDLVHEGTVSRVRRQLAVDARCCHIREALAGHPDPAERALVVLPGKQRTVPVGLSGAGAAPRTSRPGRLQVDPVQHAVRPLVDGLDVAVEDGGGVPPPALICNLLDLAALPEASVARPRRAECPVSL
jgi:hypothetical protein